MIKVKKVYYIFALMICFIFPAIISDYYFQNKNQNKPIHMSNKTQKEIDEKKNISVAAIAKVDAVEDRPLFEKEVFLTFDDGPSINTQKILKILDRYNIKATFFVIGSNVEEYPNFIKAEDNDGMCIINHSYTHQYSMYKNIEQCIADFDKCSASIKKVTGKEPPPFIRFPGGSDNRVSNFDTMKSIRKAFVQKGIKYVDWNTSAEDAESISVPVSKIENNLFNQLYNSSFAVVLMHDAPAKTTTVDALPSVIEYLLKKGFKFRTFSDLTPTEEREMIKERIINRDVDK